MTANRFVLIAAAVVLATLAAKSATPLVMENSGSAPAADIDLLAGGQGFLNPWPLAVGTTPIVTPATRLSYTLPGAPVPEINGAGALAATAEAADINGTTGPGNGSPVAQARSIATSFSPTADVWISALVRFNAGANNNKEFSALDFVSGTTDLRVGIFVTAGANNDFRATMGTDSVSGAAEVVISTTTSQFLVARVNSNGTLFTSLDLWVDPTWAELTGNTGIDVTATANVNAAIDQVELVGALLDGGANTDHILWDRIVIGDSMILVVPEPSTYAAIATVVLLSGVSMLKARARRHARVATPSP